MKHIATTVIAVLLATATVSAEQVLMGGYASSSTNDYRAAVEFDMDGFNAQYLFFNEDDGFFFSTSAMSLSGDNDLCIHGIAGDICVGYELNLRALEIGVGYDLGNFLTPFASLTFNSSDIDVHFTEIGVESFSDDDTSLGFGAYIGDVGRRAVIALDGINHDDQGVSLGGYYTLDNNLVLSGTYATPIEDPLDIWAVSVRIGWSF